MHRIDTALRYLSLVLLLWVFWVIVLGAYTRLVDAGLGCPDWPTCYGHLWVPNSVDEIADANRAFAETPVEVDKTWPEQLHRLLAKTLGIFILVFFVLAHIQQININKAPAINSVLVLLGLTVTSTFARIIFGPILEPLIGFILFMYFANVMRITFRHGDQYKAIYILASLLAGLVILQGLFGMWTVTLKLWPQVVSAHLLGGFATLSVIAIIISRLWMPTWRINGLSLSGRRLARIALVVAVAQIALGGWMSSNYAALACPDLPTCQNQWWPDMDFRGGFNFLQDVGPNYLGGKLGSSARMAIHFSHRVGAILLSVLVVLLCLRLLSAANSPANTSAPTRIWTLTLMGLLLIQVGLGLSNIIFALPLVVAVLHNAFGALLLMMLVIVNTKIAIEHTESNS